MSAMETQLRDRYLKENQVRHGVYVVGWFHCPQWATPHRGVHASVADARALAAVLDDQAQNISRDGVSIRACVLNCALRS